MGANMKKYQFILSFFTVAMMVVSVAQAGEVTSTFTTGDTLTAEKMTEIKDAVTDNDTRIENLESGGSSDTLSSLACITNEIAKFDGTNWVCAIDTDTNTTYSAGTGLTLTGTTFSLASSNLVVFTNSDIGSGSDNYTGNSSFELLNLVSTYNKISETSVLLISYSDSLQTDNVNGACSLAVRVNDSFSDGGSFAAPGYSTYLTTQTFFSSTGTFSGIAAGTHNINLYKRVLSGATCTRNSGNWHPTITIMEIEPQGISKGELDAVIKLLI